jgi:CubicO group peptidase (beta-lactamase class C family)
VPVTPDTLFYGASTTKAHTAAALALMIDSGNYSTPAAPIASSYGRVSPPSSGPVPLGWRTPLAAILGDDFVLEDAWATAHLTLEDALSHRSGLPRHDKALARFYPDDQGQGQGGRAAMEKRHPATLRDVVRSLRYLPLSAEPRTTFQYCNLMFAVASHAVETLLLGAGEGHWLGGFLRERLWRPLGMEATYFSLEDALAAPQHFAHGYAWDESRGEFREAPFMPLQEVSGAGAVVSNARDYARWVRFLMREEAPLSKDGHRAIKTPKVFASAEAGPYDTPPTCKFPLPVYLGLALPQRRKTSTRTGSLFYFAPDECLD